MKLCPICATSYPSSHRTCPTHGTVLIETAELPPGTMIRDCYRIERVLGKGGMGIVYLAEHTLMGEPRALKFLSSALAANPTFVQRFLQEARAANKLRHPNIAQTMELGQTEDGNFYISMEYVDGPSLRALLEQSPNGLPPERAFNIIHGVAEALGAAHAKRMVHRDIKPENILLAWTPESEMAKVVDFGIVAMSDSVGRLTQTGRPLLTAEYASPEQWRGTIPASELDGRTDLYALGCMFFETLTGRLPLHSDTYEGWFEQHVQVQPLAPSQIIPSLARYPGLDALVLKLLAKDREQRPANVKEFLASLDRIMETPPLSQQQVPYQTPQYVPPTLPQQIPPPLPPNYAQRSSGQVPSYSSGQRSQTILEVPGPQVGQPNPHPGGYQQPEFHSTDGNSRGSNFGPDRGDFSRNGSFNYGNPQGVQTKPPGISRNLRILLAALGGFVVVTISVIAIVLMLQKESTNNTSDDQKNQQQQQQTPQPPQQQQQQPQQQQTDSGTNHSGSGGMLPTLNPSDVNVQPQGNQSQNAALVAKQAIDLYSNKQYAQSMPLFILACNGGHADSCDYAGWMYEYQLGVGRDYNKAYSYYTKACDGKSLPGCNNLGVMYRNAIGVNQDYTRAIAYFNQACDGKYATGCDNLGWMYAFKLGVPQDYQRAVSLYTTSCNGGSMSGCKDLGWMYQNKLGVDQDYPRAVSLYTLACNNHLADGCNNLGYMYENKLGVPQDYAKAADLYKQACDGGEATGCTNLGVMYQMKRGFDQDYGRAAALYGQACDDNNAQGCTDLGDLYRTGAGTIPKDPDKARALLNKGCRLGNQWACQHVKDVS